MCKILVRHFILIMEVYCMRNHPKMEVMCHVHNCKFNETDYCFAPKLEVNAKGHSDQAKSSDEALCTTFQPQ